MKPRYCAVLAALLTLDLAACRKTEERPAEPDLSAPARVFPSVGSPKAGETIPAEAEVVGAAKPIELTLRLHKKKIKLGESLWHQIVIRNVGAQEVVVTDQIFHDPWVLERQIPWPGGSGGYGIYIEVLGTDGQRLPKPPNRQRGHFYEEDLKPTGLLEIHGPGEQAMVDGWKKQGLSPSEIDHKLMDYHFKERAEAEAKIERPSITLKPGERAETKSWFFYNDYEKYLKKPAPQPIGDFQELEFLELDKPGKYKVRAVYDFEPTEKTRRMRGKIPVYPEEVLVRTPWIEVVVLP